MDLKCSIHNNVLIERYPFFFVKKILKITSHNTSKIIYNTANTLNKNMCNICYLVEYFTIFAD